jgi:transposase
MKFIQGQDRNQTNLFPVSLEQAIDPDNEVRLIDLFVNALPLKQYGFKVEYVENGRPAYSPADLLKLFIYGYLNKVRSTRDLEKEARRNIEVMWLLSSLTPDHNTIFRFKDRNKNAIKKVFRATVQIAKNFDLIGGKLIAGDSTKLRAQNSKKNNFNQAKIDRQVAYIDNKLQEYYQVLEQAEQQDQSSRDVETIREAIQVQQQRKQEYKNIENQIKESNQSQVSTSDPDSRLLMLRNNISEVAYNVQATVDADHNILIDYKETNENDAHAMGTMVRRATTILNTNQFTALYDKGYHNGVELQAVQNMGVTSLVAIPAPPSTSQAPDPAYNMLEFTWDQQSYTYTCPKGQPLTTTGHWHKKKRAGRINEVTRMQQFKTPACKGCPVKHLCTSNSRGRVIERSEYAPNVEQNARDILANKELYRRRQAIVEHPFGTIKRQWGFNYILSKKGMASASADIGLMLTAYNLRRLINIIGIKTLLKYLNIIALCFLVFFRHLEGQNSKIFMLLRVRGTHVLNLAGVENWLKFGKIWQPGMGF